METPLSISSSSSLPNSDLTLGAVEKPGAADGVDDLLALFSTTGAQPTAGNEAEDPDNPPRSSTAAEPATPVAAVAITPKAEHQAVDLEAPSGEHFIQWLRQSVRGRRLIINDAKALVHTVANTAYLVSPGLFQRYAQEHPQVTELAKLENMSEWQWVQKQFERLHLHHKQESGLNIWTCNVTGPRKSRRLHGYLLLEPKHLFDDVPPNNPYLSVIQ